MISDRQVKRCVRCITPETFPGISFDEDGICSECHEYDRRYGRWQRSPLDVGALIRKRQRKNSRFAAIVGVSGGKDSCNVLHLLVREFGVKNVLAVTHDNGFLSDGARQNIQKVVGKLGLEHRYYGANPGLCTRLYRALIEKHCSEWCLFCMAGISSGLLEIAAKERISTVVTGVSPRTEPMFPLEIMNWFDFRYLKDVVQPHVSPSELGPFKYTSLPLAIYTAAVRRVLFINLPEYVEWDDEAIASTLEREYGWIDYGKGKPHFDCLIAPAADYFMMRRVGASKATEKLSVLVRAGRLSREQALQEVARLKPDHVPEESVNAICSRLDVTRQVLAPYLDGTSLSYRHFKSNAALLRRFAWIFWVAYKLGFVTRLMYAKYRR